MCLLSSVEFRERVCRNDAMWFQYLVLNSFSVSPMYVSGVGLSLLVTVAWLITDGCRQFPSSGQASFCRQLHVLLSFVLLVGVSLCSDDFSIRLLWLSMICLVLFMQL